MKQRTARILSISCLMILGLGCSGSLKKQQDTVSGLVKSPLLSKIYSTDLYTVYYDKALKQCVLYAFIRTTSQSTANDSIGIQTFACQPEEVQKTAQAHPFPEEPQSFNPFSK